MDLDDEENQATREANKASKKIYKYYVAYSYIADKKIGFGDFILENKTILRMKTEEAIKELKEFIKRKVKEKDNIIIKNITVMDFRELEE